MRTRPFRLAAVLSGAMAVCLLLAGPVFAQDADPNINSGGAFRTEENTPSVDSANDNGAALLSGDADLKAPDAKAEGPVRMAHFTFIKGNVTWRPDNTADWIKATVNMPLREGAQVWVTDGGRADVQFDDGSEFRLGNGALAVFKVLFSDSQGEFTQITLNNGLATLHSRHADSVYQIDTPLVSAKATGQSQLRFGIGTGSEVAVQQGSATIDGPQGKLTLRQDDYVYVTDAATPYEPHRIPGMDAWDRWNQDRNRLVDGPGDGHIPANIAMAAGDLDDYGTWRTDPTYGSVWCPTETDPNWRPYYDGQWSWCDPFGWTWVGSEPWGWAPYHYGSWVHLSYGWGWCPGPRYQYWSPGVVGFSEYGGNICWAPLSPWEIHYPVFGVGFGGPDWFFSFSIGACGVYYPFGGFCVGRPFDNFFVNRFRWGGGFGGDRFGPGFRNGNAFLAGNRFVPYNASHFAGATVASASGFGGRASYRPVARGDASYFTKGRQTGAPAAGRAPVSGPSAIQPTRSSMSSGGTLASSRPSTSVLNRSVYHTPLPASVQRTMPAAQVRSIERGPGSTAGLESHGSSGGGGSSGGRSAAEQARASLGFQSNARTDSVGSGTGAGDRSLGSDGRSSAAEAARQARESIGYSNRGAGSGGSSEGRAATSPGSIGSGRSGASDRYIEGRTYSGGTRSSGGDYRTGEGGGSRYESGGRGSSGGGNSGGSGRSGGEGGGNSGGGGGGRGGR